MKLTVGQRVRWTSSNTRKSGIVEGVIPPRKSPHEMGFLRVDGGSNRRDHESYVITGSPEGSAKKAVYWPLVSLLSTSDGLTPEEIAWCHEHPDAVRALIKHEGQSG